MKHWNSLAVKNVEFPSFSSTEQIIATSGWSWSGFELNEHSKVWAPEDIRYFLFISNLKQTNSIKFVLSNLSYYLQLSLLRASTLISFCLLKRSLLWINFILNVVCSYIIHIELFIILNNFKCFTLLHLNTLWLTNILDFFNLLFVRTISH